MVLSRQSTKSKNVRGFPVPTTPPGKIFFDNSYHGDLHIICASGLGNHFYDFALAIKLKESFPSANVILWASTQHRIFVEKLENITIRWYRVTPKENSNFDLIFDYPSVLKKASDEILQSWERGIESYLVSSPFFPDGLTPFLGETYWEAPYRLIGFPEETIHSLRPFVPIGEQDREAIRHWLKKNSLLDQPYIVMTPHVVPVKAWALEGFSRLAKEIFDRWKIRTIFTGFPDSPSLNVPDSLQPYGMPLPQVAALIEGSRLYVGHDSGLTHMALSFSVPTLTIFVDPNIPPPFIRAPTLENTPFVTHYLGLDLDHSVEGSLWWVQNILEGTPFEPPQCPLCRQTSNFFAGALDQQSIWLCSCGTTIRSGNKVFGLSLSENSPLPSDPLTFPSKIRDLRDLEIRLASNPSTLTLAVTVLSSLDGFRIFKTLSENQSDLIASWEGLFSFMERRGYYPLKTFWDKKGPWWKGTLTFSKERSGRSLPLPVNEKIVNVPSYDVVRRYYRSLLWRSEEEFSKLWKRLAEWHYSTDGRRMAVETFRRWPTLRNLRNIIRAFWMTREFFIKK